MNKIVLITGTSSGFGRLTAQTLAMAGHTVYATMRNIDSTNMENANTLKNWAKENQYKINILELDVCNPVRCEKVVNSIVVAEGRLDVLINNAGNGSMGITEDFTVELVRQQFEANVFGVFNVTKAVIPVMKASGRGLIVSLSSGLGRFVVPLLSVYSASKFALEALAEGWRYELSAVGIDSVIVEPGAYPTTNFMRASYMNSPQPSDRIGDYTGLKEFVDHFGESLEESIKNGTANNPQDVADAILKLIEMPHGSRPLRTVVDKVMDKFLDPLNQSTDMIEANLLATYQLA